MKNLLFCVIKTALSFHLIPVKMAVFKRATNAGEGKEEKALSTIYIRIVNCGNQYGDTQIKGFWSRSLKFCSVFQSLPSSRSVNLCVILSPSQYH